MATGVFGYFTLQLNESAISGNYMENHSKKLLPEGGIKLTGDKNSFAGTYTTILRDVIQKK